MLGIPLEFMPVFLHGGNVPQYQIRGHGKFEQLGETHFHLLFKKGFSVNTWTSWHIVVCVGMMV